MKKYKKIIFESLITRHTHGKYEKHMQLNFYKLNIYELTRDNIAIQR